MYPFCMLPGPRRSDSPVAKSTPSAQNLGFKYPSPIKETKTLERLLVSKGLRCQSDIMLNGQSQNLSHKINNNSVIL